MNLNIYILFFYCAFVFFLYSHPPCFLSFLFVCLISPRCHLSSQRQSLLSDWLFLGWGGAYWSSDAFLALRSALSSVSLTAKQRRGWRCPWIKTRFSRFNGLFSNIKWNVKTRTSVGELGTVSFSKEKERNKGFRRWLCFFPVSSLFSVVPVKQVRNSAPLWRRLETARG